MYMDINIKNKLHTHQCMDSGNEQKVLCPDKSSIERQGGQRTSQSRVLTTRNTHILRKKRSTQVKKKLICVSRIHYIAKKRYSAAIPHWFLVLFACFMKFRHLARLCFFRVYRTYAHPPASRKMTKSNKRRLRKR